MVTGIATTLFEFQEEAVIKLLDLCSDSRSKQTIIMKVVLCQEKVQIKYNQFSLFM